MKGGGVKGLAFAGAVRELERFFEFRAFVGTSAGAIAAVLLATGATGEQLEQTLRCKSFREFLDGNLWIAFITIWFTRGLHPGYAFLDWLRDQLHEYVPKHSDVKMQDLPKRAVVYASTRDAGEITFDTDGEHKETAVHTAARCSMSIPYFFQPQWFDNRRVYDGGLLNNILSRFSWNRRRNVHQAVHSLPSLRFTSDRVNRGPLNLERSSPICCQYGSTGTTPN